MIKGKKGKLYPGKEKLITDLENSLNILNYLIILQVTEMFCSTQWIDCFCLLNLLYAFIFTILSVMN